jgi:hypothetical protein
VIEEEGLIWAERWHVSIPTEPYIVVRETWELTAVPPVRHIYEVRGVQPSDLYVPTTEER